MPKFKYDDVCTIRNLFNKGDFFFKFDIKHGYHHVNIDKAYHNYLSFLGQKMELPSTMSLQCWYLLSLQHHLYSQKL